MISTLRTWIDRLRTFFMGDVYPIAVCVLVVYIIQPDYAQTESVGSWKELTDYANIFN